MSKSVPQLANPHLLDLCPHLLDAGEKYGLSNRLKIKFNLGNPGLNVYNIDKYIARLQISDTGPEKNWSLVLGL